MEYRKIFEQKIQNKILNNLIFIQQELTSEKFNCYYHRNSLNASFQIGEALREHLLFCVYSEQEYLDLYKRGRLDNPDKIINHIKLNRLPKRKGPQNGVYSETLLDMLLMFKNRDIKKTSIRTLHRQRSDNNEIKGFDSAHMIVEENETILLFGQAKLGARYYCISEIEKDIEKLDFLYTFEEMMFIADKRESLDLKVQAILSGLNDLFMDISDKSIQDKEKFVNDYFQRNNIRIVIPCLLAYEKSSIYSDDFDVHYRKEINSIVESVQGLHSKLKICKGLSFMFFPVVSKDELRKGMNIDE